MNWLGNFFGRIFGNEETESIATVEIETDTSPQVDEQFLFDLEEKLLRLDCGIEFSEFIAHELRKRGEITTKQAQEIVKELCIQALNLPTEPSKAKLQIILVVGVNGAGKTTSIGKLAHSLKKTGKKVLIAPCDTFRAAASEQLQKWADRASADLYSSETSKKAEALLYEALQKASKDNYDVLIVDTAGRLQNKKGLMDELSKLYNVLSKHSPTDSSLESFLVIDATTGQNGYSQAVLFNEAAKLNGIILTKFDGSAKGGILFAITHNLKIPIRYLGVGEMIDQMMPFDSQKFVSELITSRK